MKVDFSLRAPGGPDIFKSVNWPVVPREGETVVISNEQAMVVHSVSYDMRRFGKPRVLVVLK